MLQIQRKSISSKCVLFFNTALSQTRICDIPSDECSSRLRIALKNPSSDKIRCGSYRSVSKSRCLFLSSLYCFFSAYPMPHTQNLSSYGTCWKQQTYSPSPSNFSVVILWGGHRITSSSVLALENCGSKYTHASSFECGLCGGMQYVSWAWRSEEQRVLFREENTKDGMKTILRLL